jgi:hypothetical protein
MKRQLRSALETVVRAGEEDVGALGSPPVVTNGATLFQIGSGSYRFNVNF